MSTSVMALAEQEIAWLRAQRDALHRANNAEVERRRAAEAALVSLTPGGSEFAGDPERCVAHVRGQLDALGESAKRHIVQLRKAVAALDRIERLPHTWASAGDAANEAIRIAREYREARD